MSAKKRGPTFKQGAPVFHPPRLGIQHVSQNTVSSNPPVGGGERFVYPLTPESAISHGNPSREIPTFTAPLRSQAVISNPDPGSRQRFPVDPEGTTTAPQFGSHDPTSTFTFGKRDEGSDLEMEDSSSVVTDPLVTAHQTVSVLAEQHPRPVQQPAPQTIGRSTAPTAGETISSIVDMIIPPLEEPVPVATGDTTTLVTEMSGPTPAEDPAILSVEILISPVVEDPIAAPTIIRSLQHPPTPRFFLSSFQRPALLNTLIQRLQKKRSLVHSWRSADEYQAEQGVPPTRPILENLSPSQIFEYIKSSGKSIDAKPDLMKDKVISPPPRGNCLDSPCVAVV